METLKVKNSFLLLQVHLAYNANAIFSKTKQHLIVYRLYVNITLYFPEHYLVPNLRLEKL